jgi:F-type H+-transporting ATPase subunit a
MVPLAAEPLWHIGSFPITNSFVNALIVTLGFCVLASITSEKAALLPKGAYNAIEAVIEAMLNEIEKVVGDVKKAKAFFPLIATIFLVVLANNWLGLIPGTGTIGIYEVIHGKMELVPLLRPAGSDLNFTLALAVTTVVVSHFAGVRAVGAFAYFSKFFNVRGIWKSLKHGPMAIVTAVIEFGVGLIEMIGEVAKTLSLSLRLFGNVLAGEILMGVMLGLVSYVIPIPFMFLEILVGIVQATVFAMLSLVYLIIATTPHGDHAEEHHQTATH